MTARRAKQHRQTRETDIAVSLNLDGTGRCAIDTGIPFMNHMLELFGRHALVDLEIKGQSAILGFADAFILVMLIFVASLPLLLLFQKTIPGRSKPPPGAAAIE